MTDKRSFVSCASEDDARALAFVFERSLCAQRFGKTEFSHFCSETLLSEIEKRKKHLPCQVALAWGGCEDALRRMVAFGEASEADFPIRAMEIYGRGLESLSHRDYLGSVLGCGISRECVGDIKVMQGGAVVFLDSAVYEYTARTLRSVGQKTVQTREADESVISGALGGFEEMSFTLASLRLDAYVAAVLHRARDRAAELIVNGRVYLNQKECQKCDATVREGDIVTIRGAAKTVVESIGGTSKKGRTYVNVKKYK